MRFASPAAGKGYQAADAGIQPSVLLERPLAVETGEVFTLPRRPRLRRRVPIIAALVALALHLGGNPHYGFFRDELYFIVCGLHPAAGYVDQPSLVPLLAAGSQVFGHSLFALRALPAIFSALATYVTCVFAYDLGGEVFAIALAALLAIVSPVLMAFGARFSPDTIETAAWPLMALLVWRIAKGANPRLWIAVGLVAAVAAWSKYSVAFFAFALIAGLLLTPQRRILRSWWFAAGAALALALCVPNVVWQWQHQWPILQLLHNDYDKFLLKWPPFPLQQIMIMSPLLSIAWLAGLGWLLVDRQLRFLGLAYLLLIAMMWGLDAKNYYPAPVYPYLIAAGAVVIERWTGRVHAWRAAIVAIVVLCAIPSTPFVLPILPMRSFIAYQEFLGKAFHINFHVEKAGNNLPIQYYGDMTGWPEMEQQVAAVYGGLPAADKARAAIYAHNFGEASAIDYYGAGTGLPAAISGNNTYWIWGPHGYSGAVVVDLNGKELLPYFRSVKRVATYYYPLAMPYENNLPIWILRDPIRPLPAVWPKLKDYSYAFGGL
ncbi:MAG TPA: glycosyltransferase family 39 protein [Candidatus Baltobacteraceae bacterium]|nr:glycosyltransferase family 39 protein [Candidatus Baltobacteraceae bacterium]